ncbi:MAG: glycosyltransferase, partial [Thermodesulfobacteriota bacterium]
NIDRSRFNLTFCCLREGGYIADRLNDEGFKVVCLENYRVRHFYKKLIDITGLIKSENIDIVQTHLIEANLWGRVGACLSRKPGVCKTEHAILRDIWRSRTLKERAYFFSDRVLDRFSDRIIYVSEAVKRLVNKGRRNNPIKHVVIHNAFDEKLFTVKRDRDSIRNQYDFSDKDFVVGIVARLVAHKGHEYLFEAVKEVKKRHREIKILVVGSGPEKSRLEKLARMSCLDVIFLSDRDDVPDLMKSMDVFVLPSIREPFGITVIEAMYSGLPVIGTDSGGIAEIIEDGNTGILVPPADPQALTNGILTLIEDPLLTTSIAERGRKIATSRFGGRRYAEDMEKLYVSLIEERKGKCNYN